MKRNSHLTVARHLREKTHTSMLVVTIPEGEERGICSAALKELLKSIEGRVGERSVVVFALNKEFEIWQDANKKMFMRSSAEIHRG